MAKRRSVGEALAGARQRLRAADVDGADREAAWLLAHVLGCSAGALLARRDEPLPQEADEAYAALVARRERREPLQYILGTEEFMGLTFRVTPAVLIPRLDTAVLVEQAVARLAGRGPVRVADVGTGSGAIAVAVAHRLPAARVVAVDVSPSALAVAAENARLNGVADRVELRQGDLLEPLRADAPAAAGIGADDVWFDAILSNPPYISEPELEGLMPEVRDWEPRLALAAGPDGLIFYRRLAAEAPAFLRPGGFLGVEVGAGQAGAVAGLFRAAGFVGITVHADTAGVDRAVFGSVAP
ncbi:MAG: peptide chain release factor N(5)-glutamine methyltransferase [Symbiobacterium sp.]|uniref:peptide chain release factor N(5)-glutamine methyltransferase n=1 Tax=Symbiobacterium sp. TaxID=1971213 RepID=UPI003463C181